MNEKYIEAVELLLSREDLTHEEVRVLRNLKHWLKGEADG